MSPRVEMLGSVSGHRVETAADGSAVYIDNPQRGDVVEVDDDTAASWAATGMARLAKTPPVESAAVDTKPVSRKT